MTRAILHCDLDAFYGDIQALFGVSMHVAPGEAVVVFG